MSRGLQFAKSWIVPRRFALLSLGIPLAIRVIPEILAGPWPLGFDTVWVYAPFVKDVETRGPVAALAEIGGLQAAPLAYVFLALVAFLANAAPFAITKSAAPALYGFLGFSLYYFARRGLQWESKRSLLLAILSTLYFVPLRFSWDMYKNTLGVGFLFLAVTYASTTRRERTLFLAFSGLCILSSELTGALLFATSGLLFVWKRLQTKRWDIPFFSIAAVGAVATLFYAHALIPPVLPYSPLALPPARSGLLYNYVGASEDVYVYPALADVYLSVLGLAALLFAPILPIALLGFFREKHLMAMTFILAAGSFSLLVSPFAAIPAWHRWLYMLAFPALIFATAGLLRLKLSVRVGFLAALVVLSAAYVATPSGSALPYFTTPLTIRYVPPNLIRNTVLIEDSPDVVRVATWIDSQGVPNGILVANIWFVGWARLYVNTIGVYVFTDPAQVDNANLSRYDHVYVLYWGVGQGGFESTKLPRGSAEVYSSGRISLYEVLR